jgi:hypothetical protein
MKYNTVLNIENIVSVFKPEKGKFKIKQDGMFISVYLVLPSKWEHWIMTIRDEDKYWDQTTLFYHISFKLYEV